MIGSTPSTTITSSKLLHFAKTLISFFQKSSKSCSPLNSFNSSSVDSLNLLSLYCFIRKSDLNESKDKKILRDSSSLLVKTTSSVEHNLLKSGAISCSNLDKLFSTSTGFSGLISSLLYIELFMKTLLVFLLDKYLLSLSQ